MPYSPDHAVNTKAKVTEAARALFNRHGFENVSIDMVIICPIGISQILKINAL